MIIPDQEKRLPPVPPELTSQGVNHKERLASPTSSTSASAGRGRGRGAARRPRSPTASVAPPPYSPSAEHGVDLLDGEERPPTQILAPPNLPRQNRLRIHREHHGIKETFVIDGSLPVPPDAPKEALSLYSTHSHVDATVYVVGEDTKGRVGMDVGSKHGSIWLKVPSCPKDVPLQITVSAPHGHVLLWLPRTFNGPIVVESKHPFLRLKPSLKAVTRTIDETERFTRLWVGAWAGETEWAGDECLVWCKHGAVTLAFWEGEGAEGEKPGFFRRVFGS